GFFFALKEDFLNLDFILNILSLNFNSYTAHYKFIVHFKNNMFCAFFIIGIPFAFYTPTSIHFIFHALSFKSGIQMKNRKIEYGLM
ncbi:MAG TPA: hypothetical protein VGK10_18140, partial [Prolixibacteraceae bacterium]